MISRMFISFKLIIIVAPQQGSGIMWKDYNFPVYLLSETSTSIVQQVVGIQKAYILTTLLFGKKIYPLLHMQEKQKPHYKKNSYLVTFHLCHI